MPSRPVRTLTGDPDVDRRLREILDAVGAVANRDQLLEILATAAALAGDGLDRLDLKIANAALAEMRRAFVMFKPYEDRPKVTIFGSARTLPDDPLYAQTRSVAAALAAQDWMVVTGAGPGIMAAGSEGAGTSHAIGVNIRLPFEQEPSDLIANERLVEMKYFFTRKLMLMKESLGFVVLPGGFGTLDETFELFTLIQTGKADPKPVVLLEVEGGTYWSGWRDWIVDEVAARGLISPEDLDLFHITDDAQGAVDEVTGFYRNYHSLRYVGHQLVLRLRHRPTVDELAALSARYADICVDGHIDATDPLPAEVASRDHLDLPRVVLRFDRFRFSRLHRLIHDLNQLPSATP